MGPAFKLSAIALMIVAAASPVPTAAGQEPKQTANAGTGTYVINLRDVEIRVFAEQISKITGRTLIVDPNVKGNVTVISSEPLNAGGVWELFQSVLQVNGFAALRSGSAWRVVPQALVNQGGAQLDETGNARSQDLVTRMIVLQNLPSEDAVRVLRPLVAQFGYLEGLKSPNAIVVTDYAENVRRVEQLAHKLDVGQGASFETIPLTYAVAKDVADAIEKVLADQAPGPAGRAPKIAVDEHGNSILVRADPATFAEIRKLVASLDTPGGARATTRVFRLNYGDAETIAEVLRGLVGEGGGATNPVARSLSGGVTPGGAAALPNSDSSGSLDLTSSPTPAPASTQTAPVSPGSTTITGTTSKGSISIQAATSLNAIVVRGTPAAIAEIASLIDELDVRRPQVLIEAAIVEISGQAAEQLGVQLGLAGSLPQGSFATTSFSTLGLSLQSILTTLDVPAAPFIVDGGLSAGGARNDFGILVQALSQSSKANLLSTPSLTTLDNEPAQIVVGQNVPFKTGSFTTTNNSADPFTTIERKDVGITMKVVPHVHQGDVVQLDIGQEVSSLVDGTVPGATDLVTNTRSIQTTVLADNGGTIVLGGLISDDRLESKSGVPILSDIPVIGRLFRADTENHNKRTLFIFLRPTILRSRSDVRAAAEEKYDKLREEDTTPQDHSSLLLQPNAAKLPLELNGLY